MKKILVPTLLIAIIISACATATETPLPTVEVVSPTDTSAPLEATATATETTVPTLEAVLPTETSVPQNTSNNVSFANQVLPVLQIYCVECHGGIRTREGLNMTSYDALMAGSFNGAVVIPGSANDSLTVQLIAAGEMPERGPAVSSAELQLIIDWINQGAQNN